MTTRLYAGTSGFAYKEWRPAFYPLGLKSDQMLRFYAGEFPSVEINNTFYRAPTQNLLTTWREQTPPGFRFTLKAPQRITHVQRLRAMDDSLDSFLATASALDERLGCILFQCPPSMRYDATVLEEFLARLPGDPFRFAMEFRHPSWDTDAVRLKLEASHVAWCVADAGDGAASVVQTAERFVYLRLRGGAYQDDALRAWANAVRDVLARGADAYVYFKHEDDPSGVRFARRFREFVES